MNYLLDSCALLYLVNRDKKLGAAARLIIADPGNTIFLSVITAAELSIKAGKGKLHFPTTVLHWVEQAVTLHHLTLVPLDLPAATAAGLLPWIHSDPFDRILIATALADNLTILTSDRLIPAYPGVNVIW